MTEAEVQAIVGTEYAHKWTSYYGRDTERTPVSVWGPSKKKAREFARLYYTSFYPVFEVAPCHYSHMDNGRMVHSFMVINLNKK